MFGRQPGINPASVQGARAYQGQASPVGPWVGFRDGFNAFKDLSGRIANQNRQQFGRLNLVNLEPKVPSEEQVDLQSLQTIDQAINAIRNK